MNGSGAPGNRRRAAPRSPPCSSGSSAPIMGIMSVALALIAMLIELCFGYPERVLSAIGHPVTWIGRLIGALDQLLNRKGARRAAGIVAVLILMGVVGAVAFIAELELLRLPFGILAVGLLASTFVAQRSLHRHVADVAGALDNGGV